MGAWRTRQQLKVSDGRVRSLQSMSTDRTRAPSLASRAARGRPTTSDLLSALLGEGTYLLITAIVFPRARSPYSKSLLYTPMCSRTLTMARGVQGRMLLHVPGGASSSSPGLRGAMDVGRWEAGMGLRVKGEMKRMLRRQLFEFSRLTCGRG